MSNSKPPEAKCCAPKVSHFLLQIPACGTGLSIRAVSKLQVQSNATLCAVMYHSNFGGSGVIR